MSQELLQNLHALGAHGMTGVIWIIQLLVYPGFKYTEATQWITHHKAHTTRITFVVFPLMVVQLATAALLYVNDKNEVNLIQLGIAIAVWATTALIFIPLHNQLARRPDHKVIRKLVSLNWIRTILWTLGSALLLVEH